MINITEKKTVLWM